jgi:hypothetical protein
MMYSNYSMPEPLGWKPWEEESNHPMIFSYPDINSMHASTEWGIVEWEWGSHFAYLEGYVVFSFGWDKKVASQLDFTGALLEWMEDSNV